MKIYTIFKICMESYILKKNKQVYFNDNLDIFITYSSDEYCRRSIYYTKLKWQDKKIPRHVWQSIFIKLDLYKSSEMQVHKESKKYNRYHTK